MDSTPQTVTPAHSSARPKSTSRLSKLRHYRGSPIPKLSLEIVPSSSPKTPNPSPEIANISPAPPYTLPLKEFLVLSPSPLKKQKARLSERPEMGDDGGPVETFGVRKRCKSRSSMASPRSLRRPRRKLEQDIIREERESFGGEEMPARPRKTRHGDRWRKEKSAAASTTVPSPRGVDGDGCNLDAMGNIINDLVMWKDISKSSLWFGFGSLSFLSSCFATGVHFSIFSFLSRVGLLFLGLSFFANSMCKRKSDETKHEFKLEEDDILRVGRLILPAVNLVVSKTSRLFSGEPAMTLKVAPFFLVGAEYGHLITLWRLCALGFFISFTVPKLYSAYSTQILRKVEYFKSWAVEAWESCTHKKMVASSGVMAFWNLTSTRTRVFTAFMFLVVLRYHRQRREVARNKEKEDEPEVKKQNKEKAIVTVEVGSKSIVLS